MKLFCAVYLCQLTSINRSASNGNYKEEKMAEYTIEMSESFHTLYPQAAVGVLILEGVCNPKSCEPLNNLKVQLENELRSIYTDKTMLRSHPTLQAYADYYKQFKKSYHVLAQLESVIFKDRSLPTTAALVEAMFMAELKNMLLTAGHDLARVSLPITIGCAQSGQLYTMMNGNEQDLKENDMYMADSQGIISSVIYGPDGRTRIQADTTHAMFVVYAPVGIKADQIEAHFADIENYAALFSPGLKKTYQNIF
jgi:DNA/RNA-binding domain of Phe-tRNA-synthetase-like protein